jgi:small subunit ribosomal protein S21
VEIKVIDGNLGKAVKQLKRKLQQEGLFREMRSRRFYEKPSVRRRRKAKEAQRRLRKRLKKMQRS